MSDDTKDNIGSALFLILLFLLWFAAGLGLPRI